MNLEGDRTTMPEEGREPKRPQRTNGVLWGLFLIAIGGVFLYQRLFGNEFPRIWDLWPIVFLVIGTNQLLDRRPGSAGAEVLSRPMATSRAAATRVAMAVCTPRRSSTVFAA